MSNITKMRCPICGKHSQPDEFFYREHELGVFDVEFGGRGKIKWTPLDTTNAEESLEEFWAKHIIELLNRITLTNVRPGTLQKSALTLKRVLNRLSDGTYTSIAHRIETPEPMTANPDDDHNETGDDEEYLEESVGDEKIREIDRWFDDDTEDEDDFENEDN